MATGIISSKTIDTYISNKRERINKNLSELNFKISERRDKHILVQNHDHIRQLGA